MSLTRTGEVFINKLQGLKKSSLFPEITWVKLFLSPARPHKPNVYKNIYFLFQKKHTQTKNISLALLFVRIYIYIYIYIYLRPLGWRIFSPPAFPETSVCVSMCIHVWYVKKSFSDFRSEIHLVRRNIGSTGQYFRAWKKLYLHISRNK